MGDTAYNILFVSEFWHHSIRNLLVYNVRVCVCVWNKSINFLDDGGRWEVGGLNIFVK